MKYGKGLQTALLLNGLFWLTVALNGCATTGKIRAPRPQASQACGVGPTAEIAADLCWASGCGGFVDARCVKYGDGAWACGCGQVPNTIKPLQFKTVKARQ